MTTWTEFSDGAPDLAAFGAARFAAGVAYLGTLRPDGSPRVHPVTPILADELYLFMETSSPKGKDLLRDDRYSLHCAVADMNGGEGEFYVRGRARLVSDPQIRARATAAAPYNPSDAYILFVLSVEFAFMNTYGKTSPSQQRWQAPNPE